MGIVDYTYLGHMQTPDTSKPQCHEPEYAPWPLGPVHTPWPWAFPSSQPPQYVPPSSKSNRPPFTSILLVVAVPVAAVDAGELLDSCGCGNICCWPYTLGGTGAGACTPPPPPPPECIVHPSIVTRHAGRLCRSYCGSLSSSRRTVGRPFLVYGGVRPNTGPLQDQCNRAATLPGHLQHTYNAHFTVEFNVH